MTLSGDEQIEAFKLFKKEKLKIFGGDNLLKAEKKLSQYSRIRPDEHLAEAYSAYINKDFSKIPKDARKFFDKMAKKVWEIN